MTTGSRGSTPAFVGRARELAVLVDAFDVAASGRAATALVGGEAGVGKSRLVRELAAHARRAKARVLLGQCLDLEEGGLPYAPFVDMVRTLERELPANEGGAALGPLRAALGSPPTTVPSPPTPPAEPASPAGTDAPQAPPASSASTVAPTPPGASAGPPAPASPAPVAGPLGRARVFELLLTVLERLTAHHPLVLVVEDLHWADRSTDDLVTLLAASARHLPLLVVATYRTDDVTRRQRLPALMGELTRGGATHVRLGRLDRGEVVELVGALLGTPPTADLAAVIVERSDGNPLFVEELVAAIAEDPAGPMPPHLRDAVLSRVVRLSPEAAGVLRACAVAGRQVEHDVLAQVSTTTTGLDEGDLADALRTCVEHQLLLADNDLGGYRFRHALVHEAVLDEVLPGELARLHRAYARTLARGGGWDGGSGASGRWARLAHHWSAAGEYDAALATAVQAGVGAERAFAVPEAHRYLEWSVRLWDRATDPVTAAGYDRGELLARAADAASRAGAITRALTLVDEALATEPVAADPVRAGLLHERRGWYLLRAGRDRDALDAYDRAVALVPDQPPTAARARVAQAHGHALERAGRHAEARGRAEEALALAQACDDVVDEGQARHVLGLVLAVEGRTDEAIAELHQAGQIAVALGDLAEVAGAYVHLWRTLVEAGRGGDLVDLVSEVLPAATAAPSPSLMGSIAAAALQQLGRWDEADRLLGDGGPGSPPATGAGDSSLTAVSRTLVSGALAVDRGDHDVARERLETARAWCHQAGDGRLNGLLHRALAELAIWQERFDDARREVATGLELLAHTGDPELEARLAAAGLRAEADRVDARARVRATAARGAEATTVADDLMAHLDDLAERARVRNAPPTCETFATHATGRAELRRLTGQPDTDGWQEAVTIWEGIGFPYAAAYTRFRRAEAMLATGHDREGATAELRHAHATARHLGARPLAGAIERLARRARVDLAGTGAGTGTTVVGPTSGGAAGPDAGPATGSTARARPGRGDEVFALTPREAEVLALVAQGLTNRQIGESLFISEKTASVHVSRLLAKLGASTRGEAAAVARRRGLLGES